MTLAALPAHGRSDSGTGNSPVAVDPPEMPPTLTMTTVSETDTEATFEGDWESVPRAEEYQWRAQADDGSWSRSGAVDHPTSSVQFTVPKAGSEKSGFFCVQAVNGAGQSEENCDPLTVPAQSTTSAPSAPSSLTASAGDTKINLSWTDNSDNESGFRIYRDGVQVDEVGANTTSYTDTGRTNGTKYCYRVSAFNDSGESSKSNEDCATPTANTDQPNEPAGLTQITDRGWAENDEDGWSDPTSDSDWSLVSDQSGAPISPSTAGRIRYPDGWEDGGVPAVSHGPSSDIKTPHLYMQFGLKLSSGFELHPAVTKVYYLKDNSYGGGGDPTYLGLTGGGNFQVRLQGPGDEESQSAGANIGANVGDAGLSTGTWYDIEVYVELNTLDNYDGVCKVWIDGTLTHDYSDVRYEDDADGSADHEIQDVDWWPVWGGNSGETIQNGPHHMYMDHCYLSGV